MRNRIQDQLIWIDLEDKETKKLMYSIRDKTASLLERNELYYQSSISTVKYRSRKRR